MAKKFLSKNDNKNRSKKTKKKSPKTLPIGLPKKRKKRNPFIPIRSSSPKEKRILTNEERHVIRVLAAQKAAKTRKENEAKLSPEEREKLRNKMREQFLKNISKKKNTQTNETPEDIEEQLAWEKFDNFVAELNQGYNKNACNFLIECAREQANNYGVVDFMHGVEEKLIRDDLMLIAFADSLTDEVRISIQNVLEVIYSNSGISDYSFIMEQAIQVENFIYADIYSRNYEDISQ